MAKKLTSNALDEFLGEKAKTTAIATTGAAQQPDMMQQITSAIQSGDNTLGKINETINGVSNLLGNINSLVDKFQGFGGRSAQRKADNLGSPMPGPTNWEQYAQTATPAALPAPSAPPAQAPSQPKVFPLDQMCEKSAGLVVTWMLNTYKVMLEQKPDAKLSEVSDECNKNQAMLKETVKRFLYENIANAPLPASTAAQSSPEKTVESSTPSSQNITQESSTDALGSAPITTETKTAPPKIGESSDTDSKKESSSTSSASTVQQRL